MRKEIKCPNPKCGETIFYEGKEPKYCTQCSKPLSKEENTNADYHEGGEVVGGSLKEEILHDNLHKIEQRFYQNIYYGRPINYAPRITFRNETYEIRLPRDFFYLCPRCGWRRASQPILPLKCSGCGLGLYFQREGYKYPKPEVQISLLKLAPQINILKIL